MPCKVILVGGGGGGGGTFSSGRGMGLRSKMLRSTATRYGLSVAGGAAAASDPVGKPTPTTSHPHNALWRSDRTYMTVQYRFSSQNTTPIPKFRFVRAVRLPNRPSFYLIVCGMETGKCAHGQEQSGGVRRFQIHSRRGGQLSQLTGGPQIAGAVNFVLMASMKWTRSLLKPLDLAPGAA